MTISVKHETGLGTLPVLWMEYVATETTSTVVHTMMNGETVAHYGPATPRRTRLALLYDDEGDSQRAVEQHRLSGWFQITDPDRPTHTMRYVVVGDVTRTLDPATASVWIVTIDAQEVTL